MVRHVSIRTPVRQNMGIQASCPLLPPIDDTADDERIFTLTQIWEKVVLHVRVVSWWGVEKKRNNNE